MIAGRYRLHDRVASSRAAITWDAHDLLLRRPVRIVATASPDPGLLMCAQEAARCSSQALVPILDADADGTATYVVSAPPEGICLTDAATLPLEAGLDALIQVADGLAELGDRGVAHRPPTAAHIALDEGRPTIDQMQLLDPAAGSDGTRDAIAIAGLAPALLIGSSASADGSLRAADPHIPRQLDRVLAEARSGQLDLDDFRDQLVRIRLSLRPEGPSPAQDDQPHGWFRGWLLVPVVVVILALAIFLVARLVDADAPPEAQAEAPGRAVPAAGLPIAAVSAAGTPSEGAGDAIDGDRSTAWIPRADSGLLLDLGRPRVVTGLRMLSPAEGWTFEVLVGDTPESLTRTATVDAANRLRLPLTPVRTRYVQITVTDVGATADGMAAAAIAELQIEGAR